MQIALNSAAAGMQISVDRFASAGASLVHETSVGDQEIAADPVPMSRIGDAGFTALQESSMGIEAAAVAMAAAQRAYGASTAVMKASAEMEATLLSIAG